MTDYNALIAEAEDIANHNTATRAVVTIDLLRRLAAALRGLAPPPGWVATEYVRGDVYSLKYPRVAQTHTGSWVATNGAREFPTAREAMAALENDNG
jgi:hypothetical protein